MLTVSRLVLAVAVAAGLGSIAPAQAYDPFPYECVTYPCYPAEDPRHWLEGEVTIRNNPFVVCVTEPCDQPAVEVCVKRLENCPPPQ